MMKQEVARLLDLTRQGGRSLSGIRMELFHETTMRVADRFTISVLVDPENLSRLRKAHSAGHPRAARPSLPRCAGLAATARARPSAPQDLAEHAETEQSDRSAENDPAAQRDDRTGQQRSAAEQHTDKPRRLGGLLPRKPPGRTQQGQQGQGSKRDRSYQNGMASPCSPGSLRTINRSRSS